MTTAYPAIEHGAQAWLGVPTIPPSPWQNIWQQAAGLQKPLNPWDIFAPIDWWGKFAASRLAYPFTQEAQQTMPRFGTPEPLPGGGASLPRKDVPMEAYEQWQAPWGVKGAMELGAELPIWMGMPAPSATAGWAATKTLPTAAKIAARVPLAPFYGMEQAPGAVIKGVTKLIPKVTPTARELVTVEMGGLKIPKPRVTPVTEVGGIGKPPKSPLATVEAMWGRGREPVPKDVPARILKLQEQLNDIYYGLRRMQTKVAEKIEIIPGSDKDVITLLTRAPGVANAGATRYILTINEIKNIAPNIMVDDINTIIFANHAKEVLLAKGEQRVMAGGFKTTGELDQVLSQLQSKLGTENYGKAQRAAEVVQRIYNQERERLVKEGLISEELGVELAQKYPWYNPLHYVDYAEQEALKGKSVRPFTVISSGLRRLSEKGTTKEAVSPLEVLGDQLIRNEVRIHKNQTAKAIIQLALEDKIVGVNKITGIRPVAQAEGEVAAKIGMTLSRVKDTIFEIEESYPAQIGGLTPRKEAYLASLKIVEKRASDLGLSNDTILSGETLGTLPEFTSAWGVKTKLSYSSILGREAGKATQVIFRPTKMDIPGTLSFFENGTRQIYEVPDWIYRESAVLSRTISNPVSSLIGALNGVSRAAFTSFSPPFVVSNMLNDMLTAFISRGVLPTQTGMRLIGSLRGLENDKIMQSFRLAGGYQMRFYGRSAGELAKEVGVTGGKIAKNNWSFRKIIIDAIPRAGEMGEQSTRTALFERELSKGLPNWRGMTAEQIAVTPIARKAAADSVELTINFGRGAYLVKAANPFVIFLNANVEAMKLPLRILRSNPNARWRLAATGAGAVGITAYNLSYPEYFDVPNSIRWGSFMVMLPSKEKDERGNAKPNYVCIVPRTREWGTFLGSLTYAMEKLYSDNPTDFGKFSATMAPMIAPISGIFPPVPQLVEELYEQKANWDFYRSAPIIPAELQGLPKEQQTAPWVSRTIQSLANTFNISPLALQHATQGLFGGAGQTITSLTDLITNWVNPPKVEPRIVNLAEQYKTITTDIERNKFLMNLSPEDKEAMFNQLRQPEKGIPIITPIIQRIMPGRGGQLYRTGQELAEKATGISSEQTQEAYRVLGKIADSQLVEQRRLDAAFTSRQITGTQWREGRSELGIRYQGALDALGIQFPSALQVQQDSSVANAYYNVLNTLAGTIPDMRERSAVLAAGWYAIDLQEAEPGQKDWDTFFTMRENYKQSLSPEDRSLLEEYLISRMTPTEQIYNQVQTLLRPYWEIADRVWAQYPPEVKQLADQITILENTNPALAKQVLQKHPYGLYILAARKQIAQLRQVVRESNPVIQMALRAFY